MKGAGGGKRKGRKATRAESDDRPRGYESKRMRQLWRDIDDAKHKAGLGSAPEAAPSSLWDFASGIERVTAMAADVAAWVAATAPRVCELLAGGVEVLRGVPIVGRLVELVPMPATHENARAAASRGSRLNAPNGATPGHSEGPPDGEWIH